VTWRWTKETSRVIAVFFGGIWLLGTCAPIYAQSIPQPSYRAPWVAVASPEYSSVTIKEKEWSSVISFRPAKTLVLDKPVIEQGKRGTRLEAGTLMVAMNDDLSIACQLERPSGRYFIGCVEDFTGDGTYEGFFLLNHSNPFLFSAFRQPRHQKHWKIEPVKLAAINEAQVPEVKMVFLFDSRAELVQQSRFQLCVMREGVKNIWGDATHARGCLPTISIKDGGDPVSLTLYGRKIVVSVPTIGVGNITLTAQPDAIAVEL
jgi:hypothetical protein